MFIFSAAFSIGRRYGSGSIRCFSAATRFAPWPRIPNRESPPPRISRVPHLMLSSRTKPQVYLYDLDLADDSQRSTVIKLDREISLPEIAGCISSSHGFVFSLVPGFNFDMIVAVNPLSGDKLRLPPIPGVATDPRFDRTNDDLTAIHSRVTLSPSLDFALLLHRNFFSEGCIYFARIMPRDEEWTRIPSPMSEFDDCTFHKGRLIAVNDTGDFTTFNDACDPSKPPRALVHASNLDCEEVESTYRKYLVESPDGDDLFLVHREEELIFQRPHRTRRFQVYRLDKNDKYKWKRVEGLGGLAFFVGPIRSFALPAAGFPCLKPDSIYFTADLCCGDCELPDNGGGLGDTGVFNLQDGTIQFFQLPDMRNGADWLPPTWVVPTPLSLPTVY